jgi:hypothetical protein
MLLMRLGQRQTAKQHNCTETPVTVFDPMPLGYTFRLKTVGQNNHTSICKACKEMFQALRPTLHNFIKLLADRLDFLIGLSSNFAVRVNMQAVYFDVQV